MIHRFTGAWSWRFHNLPQSACTGHSDNAFIYCSKENFCYAHPLIFVCCMLAFSQHNQTLSTQLRPIEMSVLANFDLMMMADLMLTDIDSPSFWDQSTALKPNP